MNLEKVIGVRNDKTVYKDNDKVVKVFNGDYSASNVLNEALNQARVQETGLPIPKLLEVTKIENKWAIISEYAQGQTLEKLMHDNMQKVSEYLNEFVDIQIQIHSKKSPLLNKLKDKMKRKISQTDLDEAIKYELHTKLESMPKHDKVCHGDFNPSNVIVSDSGQICVIDWAHATQGNASADAATTYLSFWIAGNISLAENYLDLFCEKTKTDKKYVQEWIPIVAAAQLTKGNKAEREFLLHLIDVVDYQ